MGSIVLFNFHCILCLFPILPWVGLQSVIVAFPRHTHFFLLYISSGSHFVQKGLNGEHL